MKTDPIDPDHYKCVAPVECIEITSQCDFCRGNAIKYLWRCDAKDEKETDLRKALWYLKRVAQTEPKAKAKWIMSSDWEPDDLEVVAGWFGYNVGSAIVAICKGDIETAIYAIDRELDRT